ncbi:hypothetical protein EDB92DRAFT_389581 [Lactarius akahatsu]|uniref:Uncharacterized protein n=1 Tax=Lactarius akahatsu TaxID=416441 RepID=A0AAD4L5V0_9AGAM|nr:hypothetical protein EDB92DRAFT_389581 [Lactarius akahatsu]
MAHAVANRKRQHHEATDGQEPQDPAQITRRKQAAISRRREAQERLERLRAEAEALAESEAALSKEIEAADNAIVKAAIAQLKGGTKAAQGKWGRLVSLTARWRHAGNVDEPIGSRPDLKRSLPFAAGLRLARHVTWAQWQAIDKCPEHIETVLGLCKDGCQKELETDWGPYRFCLAQRSPELIPAFLLERAVEVWSAAGRFEAQDFINAATQATRGYVWSPPDPSRVATVTDPGLPEPHGGEGNVGRPEERQQQPPNAPARQANPPDLNDYSNTTTSGNR